MVRMTLKRTDLLVDACVDFKDLNLDEHKVSVVENGNTALNMRLSQMIKEKDYDKMFKENMRMLQNPE